MKFAKSSIVVLLIFFFEFQTLWPRHCVQESWGAELHKDLKVKIKRITAKTGAQVPWVP